MEKEIKKIAILHCKNPAESAPALRAFGHFMTERNRLNSTKGNR